MLAHTHILYHKTPSDWKPYLKKIQENVLTNNIVDFSDVKGQKNIKRAPTKKCYICQKRVCLKCVKWYNICVVGRDKKMSYLEAYL